MCWSAEVDAMVERGLSPDGGLARDDGSPENTPGATQQVEGPHPASLISEDFHSRSPPLSPREWTGCSHRTSCVLFYTLVLCIFLSACEKPPPLRIGLMPWPGYEIFRLAEEKALFKAEGVDVQLLTFASLGDTRRAFERNQIDAMCCTVVEVVSVYGLSDRKPRAVWVIDSSEGDDVIIARAPISRVDELRGRSIGVEPATSHSVLLIRALQKAGLSQKDVRLRPMSVTNLPTAFIRGEIDAASVYRTFSRELLRQPDARVIFSSKETPEEFLDVLAVEASVLEKRRSAIIAVTRALDRAQQYTTTQSEEAFSIMARFQQVSPEEFKADFKDVHLISGQKQKEFFASGGTLFQALSKTADVLRAAGQIRAQVAPEAITADLFTPANKE